MKSLPSVRWVFVLHPRMLTSTFGALAKILCDSIVRWIINYIGREHTGEIYLRQSAETMRTNSRKAFKGLFVHGCVWQFLQTWRFEGSSTSCSEGKGGARDNSVYRLGTERDSSSSRLLVCLFSSGYLLSWTALDQVCTDRDDDPTARVGWMPQKKDHEKVIDRCRKRKCEALKRDIYQILSNIEWPPQIKSRA